MTPINRRCSWSRTWPDQVPRRTRQPDAREVWRAFARLERIFLPQAAAFQRDAGLRPEAGVSRCVRFGRRFEAGTEDVEPGCVPGLTAYRRENTPLGCCVKCGSVSAESVTLIPQCAECGKAWLPGDRDPADADARTSRERRRSSGARASGRPPRRLARGPSSTRTGKRAAAHVKAPDVSRVLTSDDAVSGVLVRKQA